MHERLIHYLWLVYVWFPASQMATDLNCNSKILSNGNTPKKKHVVGVYCIPISNRLKQDCFQISCKNTHGNISHNCYTKNLP